MEAAQLSRFITTNSEAHGFHYRKSVSIILFTFCMLALFAKLLQYPLKRHVVGRRQLRLLTGWFRAATAAD